MSTEKERAAFETWVKHELLDGGLINLEREEGGEYSHSAANLAWEVWQAACASGGRTECAWCKKFVDFVVAPPEGTGLCICHGCEAAYLRGRTEQAKEDAQRLYQSRLEPKPSGPPRLPKVTR
jgi:hypothetical protein